MSDSGHRYRDDDAGPRSQRGPLTRRRRVLGSGLAAGLALANGSVALAQPSGSGRPASPLPDPAQVRHWLQAGSRPRVLIMRHAQTVSGTGDPPGYRLDDCATQRNLAEEGKHQARVLGALLRAAGAEFDEVRSSHWCRCLDTARLAFGRVEAWSPLDSFFDAPDRGPSQIAQLRRAMQAMAPSRRVAWVTHQVVVTGLTGSWAASGEVLILEPQAAGDPPVLVARFIPV